MGLALDNPFHIDGAGQIAAVSDPNQQIRLRLQALINTTPGERVMRATYGAGVSRYLFDVNDPLQLTLIKSRVNDAINMWEKGVVVDSVDAQSQDPAGGAIELLVNYRVPSTGDSRSITITVAATSTYGWPEGG